MFLVGFLFVPLLSNSTVLGRLPGSLLNEIDCLLLAKTVSKRLKLLNSFITSPISNGSLDIAWPNRGYD
jgi:hypothetical protein